MRKDLNVAADELNLQIGTWFSPQEPVHIVAHSTGGLVARTFLKRYPDHWRAFWDSNGNGKSGGRLIMLGTPNYGSFTALQIMTGVAGIVKTLALLDQRADLRQMLETFNSFPGLYHILPSPFAMPAIRRLYNSGTYSKLNLHIAQQHLDKALAHHTWLRDVVDPDRMVYIGGYDQPTPYAIAEWNKLDKTRGYSFTSDGDGLVPHKLGPLTSVSGGTKVPIYWLNENHGNLPSNKWVLKALDSLLKTGVTELLAPLLPRRTSSRSQESLREQYESEQTNDAQQLEIAMRALGVSLPEAGNVYRLGMPVPNRIAAEERKVEEVITRGFLDYQYENAADDRDAPHLESIENASIEIALVYGGIETIAYESGKTKAEDPVDAIAVGHYVGVLPTGPALALDRAISFALQQRQRRVSDGIAPPQLLITTYVNSGLFQGELGQLFFIQDPRKSKTTDRQVVFAGMGEAGRFGVAELTMLSRSLVWALGVQNRRHLAAVLIGSGHGNLSIRDAVSAWLNGLRDALTGSPTDNRLQRISFVEYDPRKILLLDRILSAESQVDYGFGIKYKQLSATTISSLQKQAERRAKKDLQVSMRSSLDIGHIRDPFVGRVSLRLNAATNAFNFAGITETNVVPEGETIVDHELLWATNNDLVGEPSGPLQLERSQFLQELLLPVELRKQLYGAAPLVLMLDSTTARIHWEMVAQPSPSRTPRVTGLTKFEFEDGFLGTTRGVTRQLRTPGIAPIEPFNAQRYLLRVLIVADPAEDARLPQAEAEGALIAELFNNYNLRSRETRIEVKSLFGPLDATRTNVLRELMLRRYDVLHFTGHCVFEWDGNPNLLGWVFNSRRKELLGPNELNRIDRIPKFVFSNASEVGITADRARERSDRLAPGFAEAFLARGVQNFVCPAWPVEDESARGFALQLYSRLLGAYHDGVRPAVGALPMFQAMREARIHVATTPNGRTAWGAYQHYGSPYFRFFYDLAQSRNEIIKSHAVARRRISKPRGAKRSSQKRQSKK